MHVSRTQLMSFLLPILVSHLVKDTTSALRQRLHESGLARLTAVGQQHPAEFKETLASHPQLKARLEEALLANRAMQQQQQAVRSEAANRARAAAEEPKPSIKLTMDFSNFAKK